MSKLEPIDTNRYQGLDKVIAEALNMWQEDWVFVSVTNHIKDAVFGDAAIERVAKWLHGAGAWKHEPFDKIHPMVRESTMKRAKAIIEALEVV